MKIGCEWWEAMPAPLGEEEMEQQWAPEEGLGLAASLPCLERCQGYGMMPGAMRAGAGLGVFQVFLN